MKILRFILIVSVSCGWIAAANGAEPTKPAAPAANETRVPDTLMFNIDELNDVQSRAASVSKDKEDKKKRDSDAIEGAKLYLSTILYYGPNDWTIWVNGVAIGPRQEFQSFQITDIKPSYVEMTVPLSALGMRPIKLSPNQTFIVASGTVVEGPW